MQFWFDEQIINLKLLINLQSFFSRADVSAPLYNRTVSLHQGLSESVTLLLLLLNQNLLNYPLDSNLGLSIKQFV